MAVVCSSVNISRSSDGVCTAGTAVVSHLKMGEMEEADHIATDTSSQKVQHTLSSRWIHSLLMHHTDHIKKNIVFNFRVFSKRKYSLLNMWGGFILQLMLSFFLHLIFFS